jgi:hypothetical protein
VASSTTVVPSGPWCTHSPADRSTVSSAVRASHDVALLDQSVEQLAARVVWKVEPLGEGLACERPVLHPTQGVADLDDVDTTDGLARDDPHRSLLLKGSSVAVQGAGSRAGATRRAARRTGSPAPTAPARARPRACAGGR